jgi:hypothetical protein
MYIVFEVKFLINESWTNSTVKKSQIFFCYNKLELYRWECVDIADVHFFQLWIFAKFEPNYETPVGEARPKDGLFQNKTVNRRFHGTVSV